MFHKKAIIITDSSGICDYIKNKETVLFYEAQNVNDLIQKIDVAVKWLGLRIKGAKEINTHSAQVEFIARFIVGSGKEERLHELSHFECLDNRWYYKTGLIID